MGIEKDIKSVTLKFELGAIKNLKYEIKSMYLGKGILLVGTCMSQHAVWTSEAN